MRKYISTVLLIVALILQACEENGYLTDVYIKAEASFKTEKKQYDVFESVTFENTGSGQKFVIYTGDEGHIYGKAGDTGFATASNGIFSYSYQEPGIYKAVWLASSINENGDIEFSKDSTTIEVVATNGGLDFLYIYRLCRMPNITGLYYEPYGEFVSEDTLMVPIIYEAWTGNYLQKKLMVNFELSSQLSSFYWYNPLTGEDKLLESGKTSTSKIINFVEDGAIKVQKFKVVTASGISANYYVAPVMIPQFTKFSINGVQGKITRNISYYERFEIEVSLPLGTDLSKVTPEFEVLNNDINLVGDNVEVSIDGEPQISGQTTVDFSSKSVTYDIKYQLLDSDNPTLIQNAKINVIIK